MAKYIPPLFLSNAFTCIFCDVLAPMKWVQHRIPRNGGFSPTDSWDCVCSHCHETSLWLFEGNDVDFDGDNISIGRLLNPSSSAAPLGHADLPEECKRDYDEAREISSQSPRGAAALLRLCLQKLCVHLGGGGKNINDDIAKLVRDGLAPQIQQALDYVRVTGNHAVHPGEISLEENPEHVTIMFDMINLIVEELICRPKLIAERFSKLPEGALTAIAKRDTPKLLTNESGG